MTKRNLHLARVVRESLTAALHESPEVFDLRRGSKSSIEQRIASALTSGAKQWTAMLKEQASR